MKLTKKDIKAIKGLGWSVKKYDNYYCLENGSPANEHMVIEAKTKEEIINCCEYFDVDEHFELWFGKHRGEPQTARLLLEDCEAQEKMYEELERVLK